jgi:hypothetical protein
VDEGLRDAVARDQRIVLLVAYAPDWAEGKDPPRKAEDGTWKPDADAFRDFATALAVRYSGSYADSSGPLPRVDYFQVWGEPNLELNLAPQWSENDRARSPIMYRDLVNALTEGLRAAGSTAQVIAGGTAPYGDEPGKARMRPLAFLRRFLCLRGRRALERANCGGPAPRFDVFGHNPINTTAGPYDSAFHPDDATTADFGRVGKILRAAERQRIVRGRHQLWALELWWETNPPDRRFGRVSPELQARWLQDAFYVLWRERASAVLWLQVGDDPIDPEAFGNATYQSGLFREDGSAKPSFAAFRFPFAISPFADGRTVVWTLPPTSGTLTIERREGDVWQPVESISVLEREPEQIRLPLRRRAELRASLNGETSPSATG